jgi:hypothetical protein
LIYKAGIFLSKDGGWMDVERKMKRKGGKIARGKLALLRRIRPICPFA